jgi:tRNA nucleotidyltransferase (CCA-adding enzyme)
MFWAHAVRPYVSMTRENFVFQNDPLFQKACEVARAARDAGGRALLVGGFVRDALLGLVPKDGDMEIYGLEAEKLRALLQNLGRVDCVGESFRVYKLVWRARGGSTPKSTPKARYELDVSLPRRDKKVGAGHRGFEVEGDPFASVEDAARRRDFTVNAILLDPLSMEILDPFGGRADLENRILRVVDEKHFAEDSLRVLRAVQFAARFEMHIEANSTAICQAIPLSDLPRERVWGEVAKWLLKSEKPSIGLRVAQELGVLQKLFPFLEAALARRGAEVGSTLDRAAREKTELPIPKQITLMLCALGIFGGKSEVETLLDSLGIFTLDGYNIRRQTIVLCGERKRISDWFRKKGEIEDREFRFLSARLEPIMLYKLARARGDLEAAEWFQDKMKSLEVWHGPPAPFLQGRDLLAMGMQPGPRVGEVLQTVWAAQLAGAVSTPDAAQELAKEILSAAEKRIAL